jgi:hypothetical protein
MRSLEDLTGADGLFKRLKKALIERALGAELSEHLGYEKGDPAGRGSGNSRNGTSAKTVLTDDGEIDIAVPRDRAGSFEPSAARFRRNRPRHARKAREGSCSEAGSPGRPHGRTCPDDRGRSPRAGRRLRPPSHRRRSALRGMS